MANLNYVYNTAMLSQQGSKTVKANKQKKTTLGSHNMLWDFTNNRSDFFKQVTFVLLNYVYAICALRIFMH